MILWLVCELTLLACGCQATLTSEEIQIFRDNGVNVIDKDGVTWTLEHHGVPEHGFEGSDSPFNATAQNHSFDVPKYATFAEEKGCLGLGAIGMSISGAPFFNPYTALGHNAVEGDCEESFDDCSGHPTPEGAYHYHSLPACLYKGELKNKFLGVAFDGYPIYGPKDETGKDWTSAELDMCHGHVHNGRYMYRITLQFPYILACYHGNVMVGDGGMQGPPGGGMPRPRPEENMPGMTGMLPPGNDSCAPEISNWQMETCYAFCHSPSDGSFDNCNPPSDVITDDINSTVRNTLTYTLLLACLVSKLLFV